MYSNQVPGQKVEVPRPVIIKGEKEWKIKRVLNKRKIREKDKYLVQQKGFTAESDTWKGIENLKNTKELVEEFEKEYKREGRKIRKQKKKAMKKRMNIEEKSSLEDSQQESYMDWMKRNMIGNIGIEWRKIGENERK